MIDNRDRMHGGALMQIVKHPSFTSLNNVESTRNKYGHYVLNGEVRILMKYSSNKNGRWGFTFRDDDLRHLAADMSNIPKKPVFLVLICDDKICALDRGKINDLLDTSKPGQQVVTVFKPMKRALMRVTSKLRGTPFMVPDSDFPARLLAHS
jgi:hypothetical protein